MRLGRYERLASLSEEATRASFPSRIVHTRGDGIVDLHTAAPGPSTRPTGDDDPFARVR